MLFSTIEPPLSNTSRTSPDLALQSIFVALLFLEENKNRYNKPSGRPLTLLVSERYVNDAHKILPLYRAVIHLVDLHQVLISALWSFGTDEAASRSELLDQLKKKTMNELFYFQIQIKVYQRHRTTTKQMLHDYRMLISLDIFKFR